MSNRPIIWNGGSTTLKQPWLWGESWTNENTSSKLQICCRFVIVNYQRWHWHKGKVSDRSTNSIKLVPRGNTYRNGQPAAAIRDNPQELQQSPHLKLGAVDGKVVVPAGAGMRWGGRWGGRGGQSVGEICAGASASGGCRSHRARFAGEGNPSRGSGIFLNDSSARNLCTNN